MAKTTKKVKKHDNVRKLILYSIINYKEKHDGRSPTLREIGNDVGIGSLLNPLKKLYPLASPFLN